MSPLLSETPAATGEAQPESLQSGLFLDTFVRDHWQRRPGVFRAPLSVPLASTGDVWDILFGAADAWRRNESIAYGMWCNGSAPLARLPELFPRAADVDLERFIRRVTAMDGCREFCWAQYHAQQYSLPVWDRAVDLLAALFGRVGLPAGEVDLDVFFGTYGHTPRGIHTDSADTLMYVVAGRKRIVVWPADYFEARGIPGWGPPLQRTLYGIDPVPYLPDGIVLEGEPGDVLYWPSTYWHIGLRACDDPYTAALNVGVYQPGSEDSLLVGVVRALLSTAIPPSSIGPRNIAPRSSPADRCRLPDDEATALRMIGSLASKDLLQRLVHLEWLKRLSGFGFRVVPAEDARADSWPAVRLRHPARPILWHRFEDDLLVSGNGHGTRLGYGDDLVARIERLNRNEQVTLEDGNRQRTLMETLIRWRALAGTRDPSPSLRSGSG